MKTTIKAHRDLWEGAVKRVTGAVDKRSTISILKNVKVIRTGSGIAVSATDLVLHASAFSPMDVSGDFDAFCVQADSLREIISCATGQLTATVSKNKIVFTDNTYTWELPVLDASEFPIAPTDWSDGNLYEFEPGELPALVHAVIHAVGTDGTRYNLCGIRLDVDKKNTTAIATDGHRLSLAAIGHDGTIGLKSSTIPATSARQIASLTGRIDCRRRSDDNQLKFSASNTAYATQISADGYPDYRRVIPTGSVGHVTVDADKLIKAIEACGIVADGVYRAVRLETNGDQLNISAHSETGTASANLPCTASQSEVALCTAVNSRYLLQSVTALGGEIHIKHGSAQEPLVIIPTDFGKFDERLELLMPVRL